VAARSGEGSAYAVCQAFLIAKGGSIDGAVWVEFDSKHTTKAEVNWTKERAGSALTLQGGSPAPRRPAR
jgi:hypothetical protein